MNTVQKSKPARPTADLCAIVKISVRAVQLTAVVRVRRGPV